jgi:hypothetical protein
MREYLIAIIAAAMLLSTFGCATNESRHYSAPKIFSDAPRELKSPGFWISRHAFADELLLDDSGLRLLNRHIRSNLKLVQNLTGTGKTWSGVSLVKQLKHSMDSFSSKTYYLATSEIADKPFLLKIEKNMRLEKIPEKIKVKYGLTNWYADQRILPTNERLFENQGDTVFDELQNSSLDLGTPVAILHESADEKWLYTEGPASGGWIEKNRVSLLSREKLKNYIYQPEFAVIVSPKADIFIDTDLKIFFDSARMGARFPAKRIKNTSVVEINIPDKSPDGGSGLKKAYIKEESVHFGYLDYTPRNIINQAFKLINAPYTWGGARGEQDCSGYIQQIFATFGIFLPRNSSAQAEVGNLLGKFSRHAEDSEKIKALSAAAAGGTTLIYLDGHIMLFLGMYEGKPYVIHDIWGYRELGQFGENRRIIGRVVVTGLELGEGSSRGSLLKRIISIRNIGAD